MDEPLEGFELLKKRQGRGCPFPGPIPIKPALFSRDLKGTSLGDVSTDDGFNKPKRNRPLHSIAGEDLNPVKRLCLPGIEGDATS
jgi:hypothetical protein